MPRRSYISGFVEANVKGAVGLLPRSLPSAVLADGFRFVPLWAVSSIAISESYHRPPLGSSFARQLVDTHDDTLTLSASLVGWDRFLWKEYLEVVAEASLRGSMLERLSGGKAGGLILVTSMTIRTDLYMQSLSFTANAMRRDVVDVSMTLVHLPRPGPLAQVLDLSAVGVSTLTEFVVG
ncbi:MULTISPECIES: hypothetical protein [unclassified Sinorhizobium]|uniref:hypothetical protein n=1 Tax=unclassified Sinorhizobium TaxID=2613772 RepID=UPI0024C20E43|nr:MULTISPECIES: hypothetical protein [unclassified Sinorhizobium]MDK1376446.1 hypothetical protein [Sinorhizobium sp. 6-70]MDK1483172.1 hypothetical protein [Sinorhizobium sp. 6-117]